MKFTLSWLKKFIDTDASLEQITDALVQLGIEVESLEDYLERYKEFTVAYIKSAQKHPDADKLRVCKVDTKEGELQIVCGAPNAREGIYVVYAPVGTHIEALNVTLKKAEIRGVESFGMMLSEKEMGISDEHGFIIESSQGVVGEPAVNLLGLNDVVIEISITPNRGDLLGVLGIARELEAFGLGKLKDIYKNQYENSAKVCEIELNDHISEAFYIRKITNLENQSSPKWLENQLKMIGVTPRSAIVDVTNYVLFSLNQPMHAYSLNKLGCVSNISVEFAKDDQKYIALDENEYVLDSISPMVVIDGKNSCIAGIKGSLDSCIENDTNSILLEAAHFDAKSIALAKRKLALNTDAAYRFERGIDNHNLLNVLDFATSLILEICGGTVEGTSFVDNSLNRKVDEFEITVDFVNQISGLELNKAQILDILSSLNFKIAESADVIKVFAPSFRNDIDVKETIAAEIIRLYGVNNIASESITKNVSSSKIAFSKEYERQILARKALAKLGLYETINMSFISEKLSHAFDIYSKELVLYNPISEDMKIMRKSIIPSLLLCANNNINYLNSNLSIFEVAPIYLDDKTQEYSAAILLTGNKFVKSWNSTVEKYSVWDIKEQAFFLIDSLGFSSDNVSLVQKDLPTYYHEGKSAALFVGRSLIGYIGVLSPLVLHSLKQEGDFVVAEIFFDRIPFAKAKLKPYLKISEFNPVKREFSFIVSESISAAEILRVVKSADKKYISQVNILDVYQGDKIETGNKSVAISVILQAFEKTFVDNDLKDISDKIIAVMVKNFGALLRDK